LCIIDTGNNRIIQILAKGTILYGTGWNSPIALVFDSTSGNLYVSDYNFGLSKVAPSNGAISTYYGKKNAYNPSSCFTSHNCIIGLAVDSSSGVLFASNPATYQIIAIASNDGDVTAIARYFIIIIIIIF